MAHLGAHVALARAPPRGPRTDPARSRRRPAHPRTDHPRPDGGRGRAGDGRRRPDHAHVAGNSLGGYVALQLAARQRADAVTAFAPAGGWADDSHQEVLALQADLQRQAKAIAPHADAILATRAGRRRATQHITANFDHIPAELLAHQLQGLAACTAAPALIAHAGDQPWELDAQSIDWPVRIVWGTADRLLRWPEAAARYRREWLPHADWVELEGIGHCPPLDVPLEAAALVLG